MTNPVSTSKGKSFLVIEGDPKLLSAVQRYLVADGARKVHLVDSSKRGLEILHTVQPPIDCIICAEDLAPFPGIELLKGLRAGKYGESSLVRATKFILMTAHREMALVLTAKKLDLDGYIVKPVDFNAVVRHVHLALAHEFKLKPVFEYLSVDRSDATRLPVILQKT